MADLDRAVPAGAGNGTADAVAPTHDNVPDPAPRGDAAGAQRGHEDERAQQRLQNPSSIDPIDADGQVITWEWWRAKQLSRQADVSSETGNSSRPPDEALLGVGQYGVVWRARDNRHPDLKYAVKNIRYRGRNPNVAMREYEVAVTFAWWPHPCIVRIYNALFFQEDYMYCLLMELCPYNDLQYQIVAWAKLARDSGDDVYEPPPLAKHWTAQIFLGLEHLHLNAGALLRDLKPDNVVLNEQYIAKLTDFSLSRLGTESAGHWSFGHPAGTRGYTAPEVYKQQPYNTSADLFSLGVLIWVLLTGGVDPIEHLHCRPPLAGLDQGSVPDVGAGAGPRAAGIEVFTRDADLLMERVSAPDEFEDALPPDVQPLLLGLLQPNAADRLTHEQIRDSLWFKGLQLPELEAGPQEVEAWIRDCDAEGSMISKTSTMLESAVSFSARRSLEVRPAGESSTLSTLTMSARMYSRSTRTLGRSAVGCNKETLSLVGFLCLHYASLATSVATMALFVVIDMKLLFIGLLFPLVFSGAFCAYAAWNCGPIDKLLPLRERPRCVGLLLLVPYGWLQWVVVPLAVEEAYGRAWAIRDRRWADDVLPQPPSSHTFHCKAVNGIFEGIISAFIIWFAYWGIGFPENNPITPCDCHGPVHHYQDFLMVAAATSFVSAGIGLLQVDNCCSRTIARRLEGSYSFSYGLFHLLFRTSEVIARVSLFVAFMVLMYPELAGLHAACIMIPALVDIAVTITLVRYYGGSERHWALRILVALPCAFSNVFQFIDSPYKQRAARKLSRALTVKHILELVIGILLYIGTDDERKNRVVELFHIHTMSVSVASLFHPIYWLSLYILVRGERFGAYWFGGGREGGLLPSDDIYSASERGDYEAVQLLCGGGSSPVAFDVNTYDVTGKTPLMLAVNGGHASVCWPLLRAGARVDMRMYGFWHSKARLRWTALHINAKRGELEVLNVLLDGLREMSGEAGRVLYDFQDEAGDTPLHVAARYGHETYCQTLAGACPAWCHVENVQGQTPAGVARTQQLADMLWRCAAGQSMQDLTGANGATPNGGFSSQSSAFSLPLLHSDSASSSSASSSVTSSDFKRRGSSIWTRAKLRIVRTGTQRQKVAPGLCSFLASSSGGALGEIFLTPIQENMEEDNVGLSEAMTHLQHSSTASAAHVQNGHHGHSSHSERR
eukprot:TRINITY_DN73301_c0_g1_i1.p1 TRINITY_DN73301_c0_g1~~TRINITY_DN73301_c0_g1_i1.p1  ORF type:complete len:1179 (+),score=211.54 TRINITY_DN73301_c0_g1_i1:52-3588(+)